MEKISARKKRKRAIAAVPVATEFCVSRQTSKQMAKEICHDKRRAMSRQKTACHDRTCEECNKSAETKKIMLQKGLLTGCQHQKNPVATLEIGKKHKFYRDKVSYVATRN